MAKKRKKQPNQSKAPVTTCDYADDEGNVLTLRCELSPATTKKILETFGNAAASREDAWHRRHEMLFERLAVKWEIAELPLTDQAMLLGRYRMAGAEMQGWVRETISVHIDEYLPELSRA